MAVEFINFIQNGIVFSEEERLLLPLFNNLKNSKKRFLIIRETWLDQETLLREIKNKKFDAVVTISFMDAPNIDYNFLNDYPIYKIGYFRNSPYYFDFHSYMTLKYLKVDQNITFDSKVINTSFMCLNGKPHRHRELLTKGLVKKGLHHSNIISFNSTGSGFKLTVDQFKQTTITPGPFDPYTYGDLENWKKHFLNVVTETKIYNEQDFFITEKTYKPILGFKPFIVHSINGSINILNKFNFENYYDDFNDITNLDLINYKNHVEFLKILNKQSKKYLQKKYKSLKEKIFYNKNNFTKHQKTQLISLKESIKNIF